MSQKWKVFIPPHCATTKPVCQRYLLSVFNNWGNPLRRQQHTLLYLSNKSVTTSTKRMCAEDFATYIFIEKVFILSITAISKFVI